MYSHHLKKGAWLLPMVASIGWFGVRCRPHTKNTIIRKVTKSDKKVTKSGKKPYTKRHTVIKNRKWETTKMYGVTLRRFPIPLD